MRKLILFGFVVLVVAYALRYLLPSRIGLDFYTGENFYGMPINRVPFWLVLAVGGFVILAPVMARLVHEGAGEVRSLLSIRVAPSRGSRREKRSSA